MLKHFNWFNFLLASLGYYTYTEYQAHKQGEFNLFDITRYDAPDFIKYGGEAFLEKPWVTDLCANPKIQDFLESYDYFGFAITEIFTYGFVAMGACTLSILYNRMYNLPFRSEISRKRERKKTSYKFSVKSFLDISKTYLQAARSDLPKKMQLLKDLSERYKYLDAQFPIVNLYHRKIRKNPETITLPMYRQALSSFSSIWVEAKLNGLESPVLKERLMFHFAKTSVQVRYNPDEILESQHLFNAALVGGGNFITYYEKMLDERVAREFIDTFAEPVLLKEPDKYFQRIKGKANYYQERFLYMINLADNVATLTSCYNKVINLRNKTLELLYPLVKKNYFEGENLERIGQTKNGMYFIKGEKQWLFKECRSQEAVEEEFEFTKYLGDLLRKTDYDVPIPLTTLVHSQSDFEQPVLVLENLEGETLEKKILDEDPSLPEYFEKAVDLLAYLWKNVDISAPQVDYRNKTKLNLIQSEIDKKTLEEITENGKPIWRYLETSPTKVNFDYHPENLFVRNDGVMTKLDNEKNASVPFSFNLANLLIYTGEISLEKQFHYVKLAYQKLEEDINEEESLFAYCGAVFQRALSLTSAWSTGNRSELHPRRVHVISQAIESIEYMQDNLRDFYLHYSGTERYSIDELKHGLFNLQAHYSTQL
ncbi:MAG: hypothetical protein ACLFP2_00545 [Candidatus Woesearchaeota archaeon]